MPDEDADPNRWWNNIEPQSVPTIDEAVSILDRMLQQSTAAHKEVEQRVPDAQRTAYFDQGDAHVFADQLLLRVIQLLDPATHARLLDTYDLIPFWYS